VRDERAGASGVVARVCVPIRSGGCVVGVLDVELTRPLRETDDLGHIRAAAEDLGRRIEALGGPAAESTAQRVLRHMTSLSALDEPEAIARAVLAAALDVIGLDSAALLRRDDAPAIGPLGAALASAPGTTTSTLEQAAHDGAAVVVATPEDLRRPELAPLTNAGTRTLIAVGLVAHGERHGLLVLASTEERAVAVDDIELLELLAAHAATCLRTAELVRTLRAQAATDPLTGLGHHATFHATLAHAHRRPSTAVVLVDLDGFKRLNDTFGHQHGDRVLREVAAALSGALRRGDTLFRIGGDEFAALLVVEDETEALDAGVRLREAVRDADLGVTVSIGVAVPASGESDAALLARADRALYRAKDAGRDEVALADDEALPAAPPV
jgi:diguanylate cyclase (GGDEF)-like protein